MLDLNVAQWSDLRRQADEALDGLLGWAIETQLNEWADAAQAVALNPDTPTPRLHAAQGEYKAYKRATMILSELVRQTVSAAEKARKTKENANA